jgi:hypothetical protein
MISCLRLIFRGLISTIAGLSVAAGATTWDEPWHREVVGLSNTLGLYKIDSIKDGQVTITLQKHVVGSVTPRKIEIKEFHLHRITSGSTDHFEFFVRPGMSAYLFLRQSKKGNWQFATPSAGMDPIEADGKVQATYRHSMHKALVSADIYEMTQICIFEATHGRECAGQPVRDYVKQVLANPVSSPSETSTPDEMNQFFRQHAALETAAAAKLSVDSRHIDRFLSATASHVQMSALAYVAYAGPGDRMTAVAEFVCGSKGHPMTLSMGLVILRRENARNQVDRLKACRSTISDAGTYMGRIMDPRIGTDFPSNPRQGLDALLNDWDKPQVR